MFMASSNVLPESLISVTAPFGAPLFFLAALFTLAMYSMTFQYWLMILRLVVQNGWFISRRMESFSGLRDGLFAEYRKVRRSLVIDECMRFIELGVNTFYESWICGMWDAVGEGNLRFLDCWWFELGGIMFVKPYAVTSRAAIEPERGIILKPSL